MSGFVGPVFSFSPVLCDVHDDIDTYDKNWVALQLADAPCFSGDSDVHGGLSVSAVVACS